jgi:hypothetical protein
MGYYVQMVDADFIIPETEEVLEALRAMPKKYKAIQRGGSSNGDKWFSWMNDEEIESAESAQSIFEALGFECEKDKYGTPNTFSLESYDSKQGQEDLFLAVVAPFMPNDAYTEWRGEDGELWRMAVQYGKLHVQSATLVWNHSMPYTASAYVSTGSFEDKTFRTHTLSIDPYGDVEEQMAELMEKVTANA